MHQHVIDLPYEDIVKSCNTDPSLRKLCDEPEFWMSKIKMDFSDITPEKFGDKSKWPKQNPRLRYLQLLSQRKVYFPESIEFISRNELVSYFDTPSIQKYIHDRGINGLLKIINEYPGKIGDIPLGNIYYDAVVDNNNSVIDHFLSSKNKYFKDAVLDVEENY